MTNDFLFNQTIHCKDTDEQCVGYKEYLKSKHWAKIRADRVKPTSVCSACKSKATLQLHHVNYGNLGNEKYKDLVLLCKVCHEKVHKGIIPKCSRNLRTKLKKKGKRKAVVNEIDLMPTNVKSEINRAKRNFFNTDCKNCGIDGKVTYCFNGYKYCPSIHCGDFEKNN